MTETPQDSPPQPEHGAREQVSLADFQTGLPAVQDRARQVTLESLSNQLPRLREPPTFQQMEGARLAKLLLWAICLSTVLFLVGWWISRPSIEDVKQILDAAADGKTRLEALQQLRKDHLDMFRDLFQLIVSSILVPLFTLVVGYAFGARQAERKE